MIEINAMTERPRMFRNVWPISTCSYIPNVFFLAGFKATASFTYITPYKYLYKYFYLAFSDFTNLHSMFYPWKAVDRQRHICELVFCEFARRFFQSLWERANGRVVSFPLWGPPRGFGEQENMANLNWVQRNKEKIS